MAMLPARRSGQNVTILDPSREFEDIYDRMGQLMNLAMGEFGPASRPMSRGRRWVTYRRRTTRIGSR